MASIHVSDVLPVSAASAWAVIRDFACADRIVPGSTRCTLLGETPGQVGSVRRIEFANAPHVDERLIALDDLARSLTYTLVGRPPFPVREFMAVVQVREITAQGTALVEWSAQYEPNADAEKVALRITKLFGLLITNVAVAAR